MKRKKRGGKPLFFHARPAQFMCRPAQIMPSGKSCAFGTIHFSIRPPWAIIVAGFGRFVNRPYDTPVIGSLCRGASRSARLRGGNHYTRQVGCEGVAMLPLPSPWGEGKAIFVTFSHSPGPRRWGCRRFPPPFCVLVFPFFCPLFSFFFLLCRGFCNVFINIFAAFLHWKNPGDILSH